MANFYYPTYHQFLYLQACGEAVYIDDIPEFPGQLEAAFVLSTVGNAKLASIDASEALVRIELCQNGRF